MSPVRAKFRVTQTVQNAAHGKHEKPTHTIRLSPVTSGSPENEEFYKWTPGGSIELSVVNDETAQQFELGQEYYVDFTPAES